MVEKGSGMCMEQDAEGTYWVATEGGLVQLHEPLAVAYTKRDGIARNKVWSVCEGNDREIWVGTDQGLTRINQSGEIATIPFIGPAANGADRCVWPKRTGGVWIAKNNNYGLYSCQNGHFEQAAAPKELGSNSITCLAEGRSGLLYVGTEGCVFGFRQEAPLPLSQPVCRFDVPGVRSMLEASDGTFWLGTDGNGAVRVRQRDMLLEVQFAQCQQSHIRHGRIRKPPEECPESFNGVGQMVLRQRQLFCDPQRAAGATHAPGHR